MPQGPVQETTLELKAMRDIGMRVPERAFEYVKTNAAEIEQYRNTGMKYSEIADLVIDLVRS